MLSWKIDIRIAQFYMNSTWEDHCKHKIYPNFLTYLHLEGAPILSTRSPHHNWFILIDRKFSKLRKGNLDESYVILVYEKVTRIWICTLSVIWMLRHVRVNFTAQRVSRGVHFKLRLGITRVCFNSTPPVVLGLKVVFKLWFFGW